MKQKLLTILGGVLCAALTAYAAWDSLTYHAGRLVYPMDSYAFQPSDIPMLLAVAADCIYLIYLFVTLFLAACARRRQSEASNRTRRLNPKLGFLGFLGLAGFLGF